MRTVVASKLCLSVFLFTHSRNYFPSNPVYIARMPQRYRRTDGQTDNLRWQYRALQHTCIMCCKTYRLYLLSFTIDAQSCLSWNVFSVQGLQTRVNGLSGFTLHDKLLANSYRSIDEEKSTVEQTRSTDCVWQWNITSGSLYYSVLRRYMRHHVIVNTQQAMSISVNRQSD